MSNEPIVIIGAGHAARRAAEALRARDRDVPIVMIGAERELPYDRPALSKDVLLEPAGERRAFVRDAAWYDAQRIDLRLLTRAEQIDRRAQRVILQDGVALPYGSLLLATGSRVRPFSGAVETGVPLHYVRTLDDARALRAALQPGRHIAVLGGGFIGLEVAASARLRGCEVTVVDPSTRLLRRALPESVSMFAAHLHATQGVTLRLGETPLRVHRSAAHGAIVETDRRAIHADAVVVGIGVIPNVELAQEAGLQADDGIRTDAGCRTADPAIYAAGEVTSHYNPLLGRHVRVESWQVAEHQPEVAAANLLGANECYAEMPWLWSDQYGCNLQMLGLFEAGQQIVVRGDPFAAPFSVFALDGSHRLVAAASVNGGRDIAACRRLISARTEISPQRLADSAISLRALA